MLLRLTRVASLANGFAYWQDVSLANAKQVYFDDVYAAKERVKQIAGSNANNIYFGNGETGWPTGKLFVYSTL